MASTYTPCSLGTPEAGCPDVEPLRRRPVSENAAPSSPFRRACLNVTETQTTLERQLLALVQQQHHEIQQLKKRLAAVEVRGDAACCGDAADTPRVPNVPQASSSSSAARTPLTRRLEPPTQTPAPSSALLRCVAQLNEGPSFAVRQSPTTATATPATPALTPAGPGLRLGASATAAVVPPAPPARHRASRLAPATRYGHDNAAAAFRTPTATPSAADLRARVRALANTPSSSSAATAAPITPVSTPVLMSRGHVRANPPPPRARLEREARSRGLGHAAAGAGAVAATPHTVDTPGSIAGSVTTGMCAATPSTASMMSARTGLDTGASGAGAAAAMSLSFTSASGSGGGGVAGGAAAARPPRRESTDSLASFASSTRRISRGVRRERLSFGSVSSAHGGEGGGDGGTGRGTARRRLARRSSGSTSRFARGRFRLSFSSIVSHEDGGGEAAGPSTRRRLSMGSTGGQTATREHSTLPWIEVSGELSTTKRRRQSSSTAGGSGFDMEFTDAAQDSKVEGEEEDSKVDIMAEVELAEEGGSDASPPEGETDEEMARRLEAEAMDEIEEQHVFAVMRFTEEDLARLQEEDPDLAYSARLFQQEVHFAQQQQEAGDGEHANVEEFEEELSYEAMLELGERLGDVRQERWRQRAPDIIAALPTYVFHREGHTPSTPAAATSDTSTPRPGSEEGEDAAAASCVTGTATNMSADMDASMSEDTASVQQQAADEASFNSLDDSSAEERCLVCQCGFHTGDVVKTLPCEHEYHSECIDQWLADHDTCPLCQKSIDIHGPPSPSPSVATVTRQAAGETSQISAESGETEAAVAEGGGVAEQEEGTTA